MSIFCKSYVDTDLAALHYVIFIESFAVSPKEALSLNSEQFVNTSINKLIEAQDQDSYLLFEEDFFGGILVYRKSYNVHFEDYRMKILNTSQNHRVSTKRLEHNKI
jgi:hypothetical protein